MKLTSADIVLISLSVILAILICIAIYLCCCWGKCSKKPQYDTLDDPETKSKNSDALIPPVFYTTDLKDPLHQEDLREKLTK